MSDSAPERHWMELFAAESATRTGEPGWLEAARKAAIARFAELGFPARRSEEWKYTNPAPIAKVAWRAARRAPVGRDALDAAGFAFGGDAVLVFVNGWFAPELSSRAGADPAIAVASFGEILAREPAALEAQLGRDSVFGDRAFAALARAFAPDGAWVHVPRDHAAARPIWIVFVSAPEAGPTAAHPRLAVVAESGSRAVVHELHLGADGGTRLSNALAEIHAGANAQLRHVKVQLEPNGATHLAHVAVHAARDANVRSTLVSLGAGTARHDVVAVLEGPGAECALDGLYVGGDGQHVDNHTTVDHRAPHGTSRELFKGILAGKSRGIFSGKVVVRPEAQKTDAQQKNENLLLSRGAEVDSKPQLEIEADDVKCSHGSTIGQLDEDAVFYLRSRGLGADDAAALLTRGFAAQVLQPIEDAAFRERIESIVLAKLFGGRPS
jgi:Fe-S cluster assembly protein SufD